MGELRFTWDPAKAAANERKHGVSFTEAETVFSDEAALLFDDEEHSVNEERFLLLGLSARLRVLLVVHAHQEADDTIRIISAWKATRSERDQYAARWQP